MTLAVKIIRQQKKIALLGAATSAAALRAGSERAPGALRGAGLSDRLKAAGFEVDDLGNTSTYTFQPDEEHPRAQNVLAVLKLLNDLRFPSSSPGIVFPCWRSLPARGAIIATSV
jgi:arginase family enzyme